jgi:hypothetical protein
MRTIAHQKNTSFHLNIVWRSLTMALMLSAMAQWPMGCIGGTKTQVDSTQDDTERSSQGIDGNLPAGSYQNVDPARGEPSCSGCKMDKGINLVCEKCYGMGATDFYRSWINNVKKVCGDTPIVNDGGTLACGKVRGVTGDKQYGDKQYGDKQYVGGGNCLSGDMMVMMTSGEQRKITELRWNDSVITAVTPMSSLNDVTLNSSPIIALSQEDKQIEFYQFSTENNGILEISPNHIIFVIRDGSETIEDMEAGRVNEGDSLLYVTQQKTVEKTKISKKGLVVKNIGYGPLPGNSATFVANNFIVSSYTSEFGKEGVYIPHQVLNDEIKKKLPNVLPATNGEENWKIWKTVVGTYKEIFTRLKQQAGSQ